MCLLSDQTQIWIVSGQYWVIGKFYTAEEALTLLRVMSDFEDESTSENEIESDFSDSSEYAPEQQYQAAPKQVAKNM